VLRPAQVIVADGNVDGVVWERALRPRDAAFYTSCYDDNDADVEGGELDAEGGAVGVQGGFGGVVC